MTLLEHFSGSAQLRMRWTRQDSSNSASRVSSASSSAYWSSAGCRRGPRRHRDYLVTTVAKNHFLRETLFITERNISTNEGCANELACNACRLGLLLSPY